MAVDAAVARLKDEMTNAGIDPAKGLGDELFLFASTLMPVVNVDLLTLNAAGEVLLTWRDDAHCGAGWHIPGGCVRIDETFDERIRRTALKELEAPVVHGPAPVWVFEIFNREDRPGLADQRERSHFITLAFACRWPEGHGIRAPQGAPRVGDMRWFGELPEDFLAVQDCYRAHWPTIMERAWRDLNGILAE